MKTGYLILLFLPACFGLGCQAPPAAPSTKPLLQSELSRLKMTDLAPSENPSVRLQCSFVVAVYHLPREQLQAVPGAFSMLTTRSLTLSDAAAFEANGLWAATGTFDQAASVVAALGSLGARRLGNKNILIFHDYAEEINGFPIESGQTIVYFGPNKTPLAKQLPAGRLSLMLGARPDSPHRGFASVRMEPLFQPAGYWQGEAGTTRYQTLAFREGRLMTTMAEGDILILATPDPEEASIFSRFFSAPSSKQPGMLLFLIVCQKAGE